MYAHKIFRKIDRKQGFLKSLINQQFLKSTLTIYMDRQDSKATIICDLGEAGNKQKPAKRSREERIVLCRAT
jgi:hypothetical protein